MAMYLTDQHRVENAVRFKNGATFWFGIGRTTPWSDENAPPLASTSATVVEELVGIQRAISVDVVYPDAGGTIEYRGQNFSISTDNDAITNGARYVYVHTQLTYDDFPLVTFRQIGLFSDVIGNVPADDFILPGDIVTPGTLEGLDNREPIARAIDSVQTLKYIIQF